MLVVGCGEKILGSSFSLGSDLMPLVSGLAVEGEVTGEVVEKEGRGPVRTAEGRICSKPWEEATCSMDLKYCLVFHQQKSPRSRDREIERVGKARERKITYFDSLHL